MKKKIGVKRIIIAVLFVAAVFAVWKYKEALDVAGAGISPVLTSENLELIHKYKTASSAGIDQLEQLDYYSSKGFTEINIGGEKVTVSELKRAMEIYQKYSDIHSSGEAVRFNYNPVTGTFIKEGDGLKKETAKKTKRFSVFYYARGIIKHKLGNTDGALDDLRLAAQMGYARAYDRIFEIKSR